MDTPDRQLRYFVRIAELKSLSRAAEDLDQTQSGLSRQLAALEARNLKRGVAALCIGGGEATAIAIERAVR